MRTATDNLILKQAIERHKAKEIRTKREIPIPHGPGWATVGSVMDCDRKNFERLLKDYSESLYVGWNPMKRDGRGCWEVWHRPSKKTARVAYDSSDFAIITTEYVVSDFEHHVYDLDFLHYSFIEKLRRMDMWANRQFIQQMDERLKEDQDKLDRAEEESIKYASKHYKAEFKKMHEAVQAGINPFWFFSDKKQGSGDV